MMPEKKHNNIATAIVLILFLACAFSLTACGKQYGGPQQPGSLPLMSQN